MKNVIDFSVCVLLMLASCGPTEKAADISTSTPITVNSATSPSATTQTAIPVISPSATEQAGYAKRQCLTIENSSFYTGVTGTIVYNDDYNLDSYLHNYETQKDFFLPRDDGDRLYGFDVSPDGRKVIYLRSSVKPAEDYSVIANSRGETLWSAKVTDLFVSWKWFNSQYVVRYDFQEDNTYTLKLLDPFNNKTLQLETKFPDSFMFTEDWYKSGWIGWRFIEPVYNQDMTRALYKGSVDYKKDKYPIVIWDVEKKQAIAQVDLRDFTSGTPFWLPDGRQFIITAQVENNSDIFAKEFLLIDDNGQVKQLTDFSRDLDQVLIRDNYSLSPDGRYVAFWIVKNTIPDAKGFQVDDARLAVLDIRAGAVTDFCINGSAFADNATTPSPPVWSPDSNKLLVVSRPPEDTKVRRVIMVDVENDRAVWINSDIEPVGWMVSLR